MILIQNIVIFFPQSMLKKIISSFKQHCPNIDINISLTLVATWEQFSIKLMEGVTLYYESQCEILLKERKITLALKYNFLTQNAKIIKINHILIMDFC